MTGNQTTEREKPPPRDFIITIGGIDVRVCHQAKWNDMPELGLCYDHFEFHSLSDPIKPIPISQTGYRSQFAPHHVVEQIGGAEAYAKACAEAKMRGEEAIPLPDCVDSVDVVDDMASQPKAPEQMSLF